MVIILKEGIKKTFSNIKIYEGKNFIDKNAEPKGTIVVERNELGKVVCVKLACSSNNPVTLGIYDLKVIKAFLEINELE